MGRHRRGITTAVILTTALLVTACGGDGSDGSTEESIEVTTSETPVAEVNEVEPKVAERLSEPTSDPGLDVDWTYQGVRSLPTGGSVVTVLVHNGNDEPLAPDDIPAPTLEYNSGGGTMTEATPLSADSVDGPIGLDLPLVSGASTNLRYAFDVSPGNLWDAELQVGNVIFEGNLNY